MTDPNWQTIPVSSFEDFAFVELFPPTVVPDLPLVVALPVTPALDEKHARTEER